MREVDLEGITGDGVDENCNWSGPPPSSTACRISNVRIFLYEDLALSFKSLAPCVNPIFPPTIS